MPELKKKTISHAASPLLILLSHCFYLFIWQLYFMMLKRNFSYGQFPKVYINFVQHVNIYKYICIFFCVFIYPPSRYFYLYIQGIFLFSFSNIFSKPLVRIIYLQLQTVLNNEKRFFFFSKPLESN